MDRFFVVTGAPGTGKTSLVNLLESDGTRTVQEPARQVLAQQREIGGRGTGEQDAKLFLELMLSRALFQYHAALEAGGSVLFDRGLPDLLAYAWYFELETGPIDRACALYRYNAKVFLCPPWKEIYQQDDERRMTFSDVSAFDALIRKAYRQCGYEIKELPRLALDARSSHLQHLVNG